MAIAPVQESWILVLQAISKLLQFPQVQSERTAVAVGRPDNKQNPAELGKN